jgi:hypothetical protein
VCVCVWVGWGGWGGVGGWGVWMGWVGCSNFAIDRAIFARVAALKLSFGGRVGSVTSAGETHWASP